jgi:uncharacterized protein
MRVASSIVNLIVLFALGSSALGTPALDAATSHLLIIRDDAVTVHFEVEIADSDRERRHGLMGRESLGSRRGMWFDFEQSGTVAMWMKDTVIPLDMLFADEGGMVVYVRAHTEPMSHEKILAPVPVRYVLELNAGEMQAYALGIGDRITLP